MVTGEAEGQRTLVSVVIAAYGRVAALHRAIRSALRQTHAQLEVLVVADAADEAFLSAVPREDPRVRLLNLTQRAGSQYGPNTVGVQHARGEVVAFLNHDDLWLEDHLEHGLRVMAREGSDFHFATAAFIRPRGGLAPMVPIPRSGGGTDLRLAFDAVNGPFDPWRTAHPNFIVFEPASAWLVATATARRIGPWTPPDRRRNVPVVRWIARAHRLGVRFSTDPLPMVVKVNLHRAAKELQYASESEQHALLERILVEPASRVREDIAEDLLPNASIAAPDWSRVPRDVARPSLWWLARVAHLLHRWSGDDRLLGAVKRFKRALQGRPSVRPRGAQGVSNRTGEAWFRAPEPETLSAVEVARPSVAEAP